RDAGAWGTRAPAAKHEIAPGRCGRAALRAASGLLVLARGATVGIRISSDRPLLPRGVPSGLRGSIVAARDVCVAVASGRVILYASPQRRGVAAKAFFPNIHFPAPSRPRGGM